MNESQEAAHEAWRERYKAAAHFLGLTVDPSCSDLNRLFFLPRHEPGAPFETSIIDGMDLPLWDLPKVPQENQPESQPKKPAIKRETGKGDDQDVIGAFNREFTVESMLEKHGYRKIGHKWLAPTSSTGEAGVSVRDGHAFSHHASDPLFTGDSKHSHDAFSVFCIREHNGDQRAAVKAAARLLGMEPKRTKPSNGNGEGSAMQAHTNNEDYDFKLREWPKLSNKALPGIAGEIVELATRESEADRAAVLATLLVRFGIECGTGPHLMIGDAKHPARINAIIAGNSSKARKGTSGKPISRLFRFDAQEEAVDGPALYVPAGETPGPLSSGEGLIYAVRDPVNHWQVDKKTGKGQWIDIDPGVNDKRLFVLDEELAAALQCTKREGNTLSTVIRCAFDDGRMAPLTKSNRISATGAHIGIVSHITNAELHRLLDETQTLNGFANRFLWICARRQKLVPIPEPMPTKELVEIQRKLLQIFAVVQSFQRISLSQEAKDFWIKGYQKLSEEQPGLVGCIVNRAEALASRLALTYALLDSSNSIEVKHLESALAMWSYSKESAEYIFAGRQANPIAQKILDACEQGPVSLTDIHKLLSNHATRTQMQTAIQELVSSGRVEVQDEETSGRPKKTICIAKEAKEAKEGCPLPSKWGLNSPNSLNSQGKNENEVSDNNADYF